MCWQDMRFLASIPELCDITFLVGETREPVCAVKAVLAARSRRDKELLLYFTHIGQTGDVDKKSVIRHHSASICHIFGLGPLKAVLHGCVVV